MKPAIANEQIDPKLKNVLMLLGRGLEAVSVYGKDHPAVTQIVSTTFKRLQEILETRSAISIGSHNGSLTVYEEPVTADEVPICTLEKRLISMKISHLTLHSGLSQKELEQLLSALSVSSNAEMKENLPGRSTGNIGLEGAQYVILRKGETKAGKGTGVEGEDSEEESAETDEKKVETVDITPAQINQIIAFLKGGVSDTESLENVKKMFSDPEKAVVLEKLRNLMQLDQREPDEVKAELEETKTRLKTYTDQIEERIFELEGQVSLDKASSLTVENHAWKFSRDELMKEVSNLTLALMQPLTVINASVEAALQQVGQETQKDLLDLAYLSGKRMHSLAKRLTLLVGYPTLEGTE